MKYDCNWIAEDINTLIPGYYVLYRDWTGNDLGHVQKVIDWCIARFGGHTPFDEFGKTKTGWTFKGSMFKRINIEWANDHAAQGVGMTGDGMMLKIILPAEQAIEFKFEWFNED